MRVFGDVCSRIAFGISVGLVLLAPKSWAQNEGAAGEAGPEIVQVAEAAPVVEPEAVDAAGPEAMSMAPWASDQDAEALELAKAGETQDPSQDRFGAVEPMAATTSSATGGSASAPGLGDSAPSQAVDPFIGSFSTAVPIQVPGFHGIAPNLALTYSSSRGNGLAGVGWSLSGLSSIERASPGKGAPAYDGTDIFLLDGQELVPCETGTVSPGCDAGGTHATEIESYLRIRQDATANTWEITGRDGTRTTYSAVVGPDTLAAAGTYRWSIASVEDTHTKEDTPANSVSYAWWCDQAPAVQCYADTITYNGSTVEFHWEDRPDPATFAMGTGTLGNTAFRLQSVDVRTGADRVRAYALTYQADSAASGRSLLADVQMYGTDATIDASGAVTGDTSLPKTVFDYASQAAGFADGAVWSTDHAGTTYQGGQVTYADVTGDARADMIFHTSNNTIWVSVATASGFSTRSQWATPGGTHKSDQASFADIDGDGKADLVFRKSDNRVGVYLSTGSGFTPPASWLAMGGSYLPGQLLLGDVNGDGSADLVFRSISTSCNTITNRCFRRNCYPAQCPSGYSQSRSIYCGKRTCGRDDTCHTCYRECRNCDDRQNLKVGLSTGTGFAAPTTWIGGLVGGNGDYHADQVKLGDLNGDGKSDLVFRAGSNTLKVALSTGTAFGGLTDWVSFGGSYYAGQAQLADLNGDGKSDVIFRAVSTGCSTFDVTQHHCNSPPTCPAGSTVVADGPCSTTFNSSTGDPSRRWSVTCQTCSGSGIDFKVALSTGNGFTAPESWLADSGAYSSGQAKYADVNGDGRADLIFQTSTNEMKVSLSTGFGFAAPAVLATPGGSYDDSQALYADVDGDGRTDLLFRSSNQTVTAYLGTPGDAPTDALTSVTNPLGGTTTVEYTPSSAWTNQTSTLR